MNAGETKIKSWIKSKPMLSRALIAVSITGIALLIVIPLYNQLQVKNDYYGKLTDQLGKVNDRMAFFEKLGSKKYLIKEKDISLAIEEMTKEGKEVGVTFTSISASSPKETSDTRYKVLPISMKITAPFHSLGIFLGTLDELNNSLMTVDEFRVTRNDKNPTKINADLVIYVYISGS